jgi:hypothetical protein
MYFKLKRVCMRVYACARVCVSVFAFVATILLIIANAMPNWSHGFVTVAGTGLNTHGWLATCKWSPWEICYNGLQGGMQVSGCMKCTRVCTCVCVRVYVCACMLFFVCEGARGCARAAHCVFFKARMLASRCSVHAFVWVVRVRTCTGARLARFQ